MTLEINLNPRELMRTLLPSVFTVLLILLQFGVKALDVLIIYDDSPTNTNTLSLKAALIAEGHSVTISSVTETSWNNTNPSLNGFDCVIHLNGTTYNAEMPTAGQTALVDFVDDGGLFISLEWNAYQYDTQNELQSMEDLILLQRTSGQTVSLTYTEVSAQSTHPILVGVPSSFTLGVEGSNIGTIRTFTSQPSIVLMTEGTNDALALRQFGSGCVLGFHGAGNYNLGNALGTMLSNGNVQQLIINFIDYCGGPVSAFPYCENFEQTVGSWTVGGILTSWEHGEPNNSTISNAASGDDAWVTDLNGDYNNDEFSYVQSIEFDFTPLVDPMIRFQINHDIETNDDGSTFQVSTDGGTAWSTLGSTSSTAPWFNSSAITSFNLLNSTHGWTGSSSGWSDMRHSLASYSSDTAVLFRFLISADGAATEEGFAFDDIIIAESDDVALTELFFVDSVCGTTASTVEARICNISIEEKYGFDVILDTNGTSITTSYSDTLPICGCDTILLATLNTAPGGTWNLDAYVDNSGDVNSANDSIITTMTAYAIPGGSVTGGGDYCEGDVAQLIFDLTGTGPWNVQYTNGTSPTYVAGVSTPFTASITQSGTYTITYLLDSTGCPTDSGSITGSATFNFHPAPVVDLGPDSTVCGDYLLDAGGGMASYSWSTGATTQSITVISPATYSVTVTDTNGCEGEDEVVLEVNPNPIVNLPDTNMCDGGTVLFNAGGGYVSYLWSNGSTGQVVQVSSITTLSVTVTDFNDCEGVGTGSVTSIEPNPTPNVTGGSGYAPVTMHAPNGYAAYLWNNGQTTQDIDVYVAGTYTCTVTDSNGCEGEDDAKARIWPTSIEDIVKEKGFAVYPNPTDGQFSISFNGPNTGRVMVYNSLSKLEEVIDFSEASNIELDLTGRAAGIYHLAIHTAEGVKYQSVAIE
jgi:hypothetical protein